MYVYPKTLTNTVKMIGNCFLCLAPCNNELCGCDALFCNACIGTHRSLRLRVSCNARPPRIKSTGRFFIEDPESDSEPEPEPKLVRTQTDVERAERARIAQIQSAIFTKTCEDAVMAAMFKTTSMQEGMRHDMEMNMHSQKLRDILKIA